MDPALALVALVVAIPASLAVHEAGHALAAVAVGGKRICAGWTARGPTVSAHVDGRARTVAFLLGGAFANLAVAVAVAVGVGFGGGTVGGVGGGVGVGVGVGVGIVVGLVNVACAVVNLVPHGSSDGARVLRLLLLRNDAAAPVR